MNRVTINGAALQSLLFFMKGIIMDELYEFVTGILVCEQGVIFEVEGKLIGFQLTKEQMQQLKKSIGLRQALDRARRLED